MANTDKDILITPNRGSSNEPKIEFKGASSTVGPSTITATIYPTNNGTLSFDGTEGSLFSIANNLTTGSIFSVNPISGIPIIDVNADRTIALNPYGGNTGIGLTNPSYKLDVNGTARFSGQLTIPGNNSITFGPNSTWSRYLRIGGNGWAADSTTASVVTTDGNLHLDAADANHGIYLNWYGGTNGTFFGNGAAGQIGRLDGSGNFSVSGTITGTQITSNIANGTAPFVVSSTTKVTNLNADYLDDLDSGSFLRSDADDSASGIIDFLGGSGIYPAVRVRSGGNSWSEGLAIHPASDNGYALTFYRTRASLTDNTNNWAIGNNGFAGTNNFVLLRNGLTGSSAIQPDAAFDVTQAGVFRFGFTPTVGSNTILHAGNYTSYVGNGTITVQGNTGLTGTGSFTVNQTGNTTVTLNHADTSSQASVDNSNGTVIQDVTLDEYGHVTGLGSVNLDGRYYTESEIDGKYHDFQWRWIRYGGYIAPAAGDNVSWTNYFRTYFLNRSSATESSYPTQDSGYINTYTVGTLGGFGGSTYGNIFGDLENYHCHIYTHIYVERQFSINPTQFNGDDPHAIFINGVFVHGNVSCCTDTSYAYTFQPGWYRIDLIYAEGGGGDYIQMGWNPKDYTTYIKDMTSYRAPSTIFSENTFSSLKPSNNQFQVNINSPASSNGAWTTTTSDEWGNPKFDGAFNEYRYADAPAWVQYNIPVGMKSAWISQLTWSSGGYVDVHGVQSGGQLVFLRRINTRQEVENADEGVNHDGSTVTFAASGLDDYSAIRFTVQSGRFHFTGLSFSTADNEGTEGVGMVHPAQISHQGAGSGLDADTVDGLNPTSANTASTIVARDGSGNFNAGTLGLTGINIDGANLNNTNDATVYITATNNNDWGLIINKFNSSATEYGQEIRVASGADYAFSILGSGTRNFRINGAGSVFSNGTVTATYFRDTDDTNYYGDFGNTGTSIVTAGNIGAKTTSPLQALDVRGNFLLAADATTATHITQKPYTINGGTLSWEGSAGQLFSITNNLTSGSIFSVNDVSGLPSIDVDANGTILLAPYGGNIGVGTLTPAQKLHVVGNSIITGSLGLGIDSALAKLHTRVSTPTSIGSLPSGVTGILDSSSNNYLLFRNTADNGTYSGIAMQDNNVGGYVIFGNAGGGGDLLYVAGYGGGQLQYGTADSINPSARTTVASWNSTGLQINNGDLRAPIYRDSDDTNYYLNPATESLLRAVTIRDGGLKLERAYANNSIWFAGGTDDNHVLWNDALGGPGARGGSGFDGMKWNTYRGIYFRTGYGGQYNSLEISGSGASNDHQVYLYGANDEKLRTVTTDGIQIQRDLYISGSTGGNYGNRLIVGNTDTSYTLQDGNLRPTIQAHGQYPVVSLNHTATSNPSHGPTLQFTCNGVGNQFVIGTNGTGTFLSMGYSTATDWNPHNGINGYNGTSFFHANSSGNIGLGAGGDWGSNGGGDPGYNLHFVGSNNATGGHAAFFDNRVNGANNGSGFLFRNLYGNHSWGIVAEYRVEGAPGADRPSILFSTGYNSNTWSVGYGNGTDDNFRINYDHGHRNGGWGTTAVLVDRSSIMTVSGEVRAPIFRDSDNTGFYLDPASTTTSLQIAGAIEQGNNFAHPNIEWSAASNSTGRVVFKLPGNTGNYGMVHMVFDYYEYNSPRTATIIVSGHNWNGAWYYTACNVVGYIDKPVYLGTIDGQYCVAFGDFGSSWSYGTIRLRKIHNGSFYNNIMNLGGTYTATQITSGTFTSISDDLRRLMTSNAMYAYEYRGHSNVAGTGEATYHPAGVYSTGTNWLYGSIITNNNTINAGTADIDAAKFRDSNNTNYYVDPSGTSVLNTVTATSFVNTDAGIRIHSPGGASYSTQTYLVTGAIKIRLPAAALGSNTMMSFRVSVYDYNTGSSQQFIISGYNNGDASYTWYNESAISLSDTGSRFTVRFGKDATSQCVYIGELASTWNYPQVFVTDFCGGYGGATSEIWSSGWTISFESSAFAGVTKSRTAGFNADLIDGLNPSTSGTSNIVSRDASGNFSAGTITATLSGNASTATTATNLSGFTNSNSSSPVGADGVTNNGIAYVNSNIALYSQTDGALYSQAYSSSWIHQIYGDYRTGQIAIRGKNSGTWQSWRRVLDSASYSSSSAWTPNYSGISPSFSSPGKYTKTGGSANTWDSHVYSSEGYIDNLYVSFSPSQTNARLMVGLNSDPTTDANYTSLDYAIYCTGSATIEIYENSVQAATGLGSYATTDIFTITYDGKYVTYYKNNTILRQVARALSTTKLYLDSSFYTSSGSVDQLSFGTIGNNPYSTSSSRLYSTDATYEYFSANPYYGYLTYVSANNRWRFQVSPATPAAVEVSYADSSGSSGSASTATNISNSGTVTLASATESNSIYVSQPSYTTDQPVKLLNFDWYGNIWSLGNIRSASTPSNGFGVYSSGTERARFTTSGLTVVGTTSSGVFTSTSDITKKTNIQNIKNAVELTKQINGVKFDWKETGESSAGVIAQEVEEVLPEIVHTNDEGIKSVNYNGVVGLLVEAIKEQQKQIDELKKELKKLHK